MRIPVGDSVVNTHGSLGLSRPICSLGFSQESLGLGVRARRLSCNRKERFGFSGAGGQEDSAQRGMEKNAAETGHG